MRTRFQSSLKTNKKAKLEDLKMNTLRHLMASFVREETLEGKDYFVIPSIAIVEGVHNNIFYSADELCKFPQAWNGVPITNGHPVDAKGNPCAAKSPEVKTNFEIGMWYNSLFEEEGSKLKGEIWLDKEKCAKLNQEIIINLQNNIPTDVSTGLFTEDEVVEGEWNGEKFNYVAKNYRPDHLAILLDDEGACNWQDGAGMARLNQKITKTDLKANERIEKPVFNLKTNEVSHNTIYSALSNAIKGLINLNNSENIYIWVMEVWDKYFIYEMNNREEYTLYKQSYTIDANDIVALIGDAIEVVKEVNYKPKITTNKKEIVMEREERIKALIADENSPWAEADSELLTGMSDDQFDKVEKSVTAPAAPKANAEEVKEVVKVEEAKKEVKEEEKTLETPKVNSVDEFIALAPEGMQDVLRSSVEIHNNQKETLVAKLTANKACKFNAEELKAKSLKELEMLSELAGTPADYSGNGPEAEVKANKADDSAAPEMPVIDWTE